LYQIGGIIGSNLADGRGNVMLAFSINDRKSALHIDRPWFDKLNKSTATYGNDREFFPDFSGYDPLGNAPSQAVLNTYFTPGGVDAATQFRYYFNDDGTPFLGFFQSFDPTGAGVAKFKGDLTSGKWVKTDDGQLKQSFQDSLAVLPLHRDNFLTRGNFDLNDNVTVFGQAMFSRVTTNTVQQPSPAVNGWGAFIPNDARAMPAPVRAMLNSRTNAAADWKLVDYLDDSLGNRESRVDVMTYNMLGGFEGKIGDSGWTYEAYASTGQSETSSLLTGVASLERYRAVISAPNWGQGFSVQGNPAFGGFGASSATCTSGLNPFNPSLVVSQDCKDAISADLKGRAVLKQDVQEVNVQGGVFDLPAGEVRAALGVSHRNSRYEFLNDTLTTQGRSFQDQSIGIYPSGNSRGSIGVKEAYAEALVPVLADLPFAKKVELELGVRLSDYTTTGNSTTWKALASWDANDYVRVRGGFNRAERSPNIAELYLAPQQTFVFNASGDLCSLQNNGQFARFSANPAFNTNAAQARTLCNALMNRTPGTAAVYYANPAYYNASGGTFAFPTLKGNPNVKPEKADTWTLGTVINSPFSGALESARLSLDYYRVKVSDALGAQSVDIAQRQCFDPAFNPTYSASSVYCAGIDRVANDGALGNIITTFYNNGRFVTDGIDGQFDWSNDVGPGKLSVNMLVTYLLSMKSSELISDPLVEYAGTLGPSQNGLNAGNFRWKMFNTVGYEFGDWNASLQWQHLPSIKSATAAGVASTTVRGAKAYDLFSLSGGYAFSDDLSVRFGIDNVLDKAPPVTEVNSAPPPGTLAGGSINDVLYDVNGRRYYVGVQVKF